MKILILGLDSLFGIPTMLVFKNGEAVATKVGAVSKTAIVEWIEDSIA